MSAKKIISIITLIIFLFVDLSFDIALVSSIKLSVREAFASTTPYCPPTSTGNKAGTFSPASGYCELTPEDERGSCLSPYVYSTSYYKCVSQPLCPGLTIWNASTRQCEYVSSLPGGDELLYNLPSNFCAVDSNNDGNIQQGEIHSCTQTPQGYICPVGQTQCVPQYTQPSCPTGYVYNTNTQKCEYTPQVGVCQFQQVTVPGYQCPTNGQVYNDLFQCNSACIQTAQCNLQNMPVEIGFQSFNGNYWYYAPRFDGFIVGSGNKLNFGSRDCYYEDELFICRIETIDAIATVPGATFSGAVYLDGNMFSSPSLVVESNRMFSGFPPSYMPLGSILYASNIIMTGGIIDAMSRPSDISIMKCGTNCISICRERWPHCGCSQICFWRQQHVCPLGNYTCTGTPPMCQAGQACVTYDQTATKWQCSITGTQYDTQNQCTSNCHSGCPAGGTFNPTTGKCEATANCSTEPLQSQGCFTGYGCPLGNYACHQIGGTWMCSPHSCKTPQNVQDEGDVIPSGYEDDGERAEDGTCLGTVYIFNGKAMRCRKSGIQTGFHNCCKESRGKLYDSTGSMGGGISAIKDAAKAIYTVYRALSLGDIASKIAQSGGSIVFQYSGGNIVGGFAQIGGTGGSISLNAAEATALKAGLNSANVPITGQTSSVINYGAGGSMDAAAGASMGDYIKQSGMASTIVSLATSMLIKDPVLSSAVNVVAQAYLWYIGWGSPWAFAFAVASLVMTLFTKRCDQQDIIAATFNESGYCHEVGDYCVKKILGKCLQKAKSFCCFNSKLARIIHQQGRPQLETFQPNGAWTGVPNDPNYSVQSPNCRGFTPDEFQMIDFNKIDLSEYIADIQINIRQNLDQQLQQQIQQSWGP